MASTSDTTVGQFYNLPFQFTTASMSVGTMSAGWITGSAIVVLNNSGATPGSQTTRTATQMIADGNLYLGQTWLIVIFNSVTTNALTVVAGSGVTLSGAATVAGYSATIWSAQVTSISTPAITLTRVFTFGGATSFAAGA